ncbi:gametocyte-specific factor 1 [Tachysurus fulvidraco]|uniref:gametocyte-specific factor 1 n=1 Tax=Tachysurus fulvidraco TaxID=1234273 RepID=UPI001FEEE7A5|nr:gametocyte-specific factor 1 [Tachysurus fulvidraco]
MRMRDRFPLPDRLKSILKSRRHLSSVKRLNEKEISRKSTKMNGKDSSPQPKFPLRRWEEAQDDDLFDPDKLLLCPYDANHQIRARRLPYHLIKCRKNNPQLASQLWTCPFNARHIMPKEEMSHHMSTCLNRCSVNTDYEVTDETQCKFQVPVSTWTIPVCDEDWDEEEKEAGTPATPFVWGISTSQLSQDRTGLAMTPSLPAAVRAPKGFAWKLGL